GTLLETVSDPTALPLGTVFPMLSDFALLKEPASDVEMCFASVIPISLVGGQDSVGLFSISCTYPAPEGYSAVTIRSIKMAVQDTADVRLDPRPLFDRVGYRVSQNAVAYQSSLPLYQGAVVFDLGEEGIRLDPGGNVTIELIADIEADSPYDRFVLAVGDLKAVSLWDVSDSTHQPGMLPAAECAHWPPVYSPIISLFLPAGEPTIAPASGGARVTFGGEENVTVFAAAIDYDPPTRRGNVLFRALRAGLRVRTGDGDSALSVNTVFDELRVLIDDVEFGVYDALPTDGIEFLLSDECVLRHGTHHTLTIVGDVKADAPFGNYLLRFEDASSVRMIDEQLRTTVVPVIAGASYPFAGPDLSISGAGLERSFTNYPNPFNPARGEITTIAYVLDRDAAVDIEIFTITGQRVITIAEDAPRPAGVHQADIWAGFNDASLMVMPGTYFCRITARYASGSVEQYRRKIAIVR
ncbi:MAG TPA: hypothetical protein VM118_13660, partial [Acidobacteriota bacterium]|nr:hypothetical protein [Acidobacteriota bacterium]